MNKWLKRKVRNWLGVTDGSYPHRIVTMINWHDKVLAVDGNGDIYELTTYGDFQGSVIQLVMKNPLER